MIRDFNFFNNHGIDISWPVVNVYLIPYIVCFIVVLVLNITEHLLLFWKTLKYKVKYFIIFGSYSLIMLLSGVFTEILHSNGYVDYVGDIYGTIVMGYWPSAFLCWLIGIPVTLFFYHKKSRGVMK